MSSSESTSDTELTSPTTTLLADAKDALNSNNEFLSSAFTSETFSLDIFSGASKLTFVYLLDDPFGILGFSLSFRDSLGYVQAKGEIDGDHNVKLRNVNGTEMMAITKRKKGNWTVRKVFDITHQNASIGTVTIANDGSLKIKHCGPHPQISVVSLNFVDFAIYRSNLMSSPICNIQIPYGEVTNTEKGIGTITFHLQTGITAEEQLLCTAAAIVFKQHTSFYEITGITDRVCGCFFLAMCAIIFTIIVLCTWAMGR